MSEGAWCGGGGFRFKVDASTTCLLADEPDATGAARGKLKRMRRSFLAASNRSLVRGNRFANVDPIDKVSFA